MDKARFQRAQTLRQRSTDAEQRLWLHFRNRQLGGFKFVRQEPVGPYTVDFVCRSEQLVIELDGGQHADASVDVERDAYLRGLGYRIVRIWNNEVLDNTEGVLEMLLSELRRPSPVA